MKRISEFGIWKRLSSGGGGGEQLDVEKMKLQEENIWILANFSWRFKIPTDPLIWRVSAWRGTGGCPWCRWCVECRPRAASLASLTRSPSCRCPRLLARRSLGRCPGWTVAPGWSFQHLGRPFENKLCRFKEVTSSPKHNDPVVVARLGRHLLCLQLLPRTKTLQCQFQIKVCIWIFVTLFSVLLQTLSAAPASAREQQITSSTTFLTLPTWKHSQVKTEALCKFNRCGNDDSVLPVTSCIMEILACALICISLGILYELYEWMNEWMNFK